MAYKKIEQSQVDYILDNYQEQTAEQLAVKVKCPLWQVYDVCKKNNVKPIKPKDFRKSLSAAPDLLTRRRRSHTRVLIPAGEFKRPPAIYTNSSPYGIADKLHRD